MSTININNNINFEVDLPLDTYLNIKRIAEDKGIELNDYIKNIISENVDFIIFLEKGFYFNTHTNKLYDASDVEVPLTRLELKLLSLLSEKNKAIVTIEEISSVVWRGKEMSLFTLRNVIKKLRDKTSYEIIKNHSSIGYSLN